MEEDVAKIANEKNEQGVRTPKHLAIKRVMEGEKTICWVLQERAKGKSFNYYSSVGHDSVTQIERQQKLLRAPDSHFDHLVSDLCALINMGTEMKSKNFFYDDDYENGGFTIIDLLGGSNEPFNPNSIKDILWVWGTLNYVCCQCTIFENEKSNELYLQMRQRFFDSMERTIPNFNKYRRDVLRDCSLREQEYFEKNGTEVGDLTLTEEEEIEFSKRNDELIDELIEKIKSGKYQYWQIVVNEIRNELRQNGQNNAWRYHKSNTRKIEDYNDRKNGTFLYKNDSEIDLREHLLDEFDQRLLEVAQTTENQNLLKAIEEMDSVHARFLPFIRESDFQDIEVEDSEIVYVDPFESLITPEKLANNEKARKASEEFDSKARDEKSSKDNPFHII